MGEEHASTGIARWLIIAGVGLVVIGGLVWLLGRFIDLGNLPGDFSWTSESGNTRIYVPLGTMIVLSLVLTLLLNLLLRLFR